MTAADESRLAHCGDCQHQYGAGCGCECCAWAGDAVRVAAEAIASVAVTDAYRAEVAPGDAELRTRIARAAVQAALPVIRAAECELLTEADAALWACAKAFLTVEPTLKTPYRDAPEWSPWTRWCERPARTAHDLHVKIRRHLKLKPIPEGDPQ